MEKELAQRIGEALIEVLKLKVKSNGRVDTDWGDKTPVGLARVVQRILSWEDVPMRWTEK